ncbi:hypothetical protein M1349_03030 [Patescibacteria group bacterium]|nr:hypothetical protein [Patescibacteria group bacterium]
MRKIQGIVKPVTLTLGCLVLIFAFLKINIKPLFLVLQTFPNIPIKPLDIFPDPTHRIISLGSNSEAEADLFIPKKRGKYPAVIMASGIKLQEKDNEGMLNASKDLSKLGYIVIWPKNKKVSKGESFSDNPNTFIDAFRYLNSRQDVRKDRISIMGFSSGASMAMIAAEKPEMSGKLHAFVFFAGYFNLKDYIKSISLKSYTYNGKVHFWKQDPYLKSTATSVLKSQNLLTLLEQKNNHPISSSEILKLKQASPDSNISSFKTPIFIIHDQNDGTVPFVESVKLASKIDRKLIKKFLITKSFDHIKPDKLTLFQSLEIYSFYFNTINYL